MRSTRRKPLRPSARPSSASDFCSSRGGVMKYRKILLAYNGSQDGKRALLECADLASFLGAETHLLAVASMPPSLSPPEAFVPGELREEEKKPPQRVPDKGTRPRRERGLKASAHPAVGEP